jgi:hypothetical protein
LLALLHFTYCVGENGISSSDEVENIKLVGENVRDEVLALLHFTYYVGENGIPLSDEVPSS